MPETTDTAASAATETKTPATKPPKRAKPEAEMVRLYRAQDGFITDPMPKADADDVQAGYPGEYEVYQTPQGANPPTDAE